MNYGEAEKYISDIPKFTSKNSHEHTREFLRRLGSPHPGCHIVHVAGTNGKGSVCAYLQGMILAEGKSTGMFISPHLVRLNERIRICGKEISDEEFMEAFETVLDTVKKMEQEGIPHPSYFEFLFGIGMYVFARAQVEYVILETGLGGRLDATNALEHPDLTIITSISKDHMEYLGDTVPLIVAEKAGIIKPGIPVIFDGNNTEAAEVIRNKAQEEGAPCREITKYAYELQKITGKDIAFCSLDEYYENTVWELNGMALYQPDNAMLSLEGMRILFGKDRHFGLWKDALKSVRWECRMEEVRPGIFIDGAHNMGAIQAFTATLARQACKRRIILFSAVREKDYEKMIEYLCSHLKADAYVITEIADVRKTDAGELAEKFAAYTDCPVVVRKDAAGALETAMEMRGDDGQVYCLGSLYLAGTIRALLGGRKDA